MIKVTKSFEAAGSIIALHANQNSIFFTDNKHFLYSIDKSTWVLRAHIISDNSASPLHPYQKSSAFGTRGSGIYSVDTNGSCAVCYTLPPVSSEGVANSIRNVTASAKSISGEKIFLYGHDQRSEVMTFGGENGEYIFTGGTDGKVYMYSSANAHLLMSLRSLPDYIAHLTANESGRYLSYSAYDHSLHVIDIRYQTEILNTYLGDVIEDSLFFKDSRCLYAISRDGVSYIFDLREHTVLKKAIFPTWPTCCVIDSTFRYAVVGTRGGYVHIVKLSDNTIFANVKLDQKGISSLLINDNYLLVGFNNGYVYVVDLFAYIDDFSQALAEYDYPSAKKCLDKNVFLTIHPMSQMFEEAWEKLLHEIREQFSVGNTANAMESAAPFLSDVSRKKEFDFLFQKQKEFEKFRQLVEKKLYPEAYALLEVSPYLHKTDSARKLEAVFTKTFAQAKKIIAADPLRNFPRAQELLKPFSKVASKKEIIFSLIKKYPVFLKADTYVKERNFKSYFLLTEEHPLLKNEDIYKKLCTIAENNIEKIQLYINTQRYNEAVETIKQIVPFLPYKQQLSRLAHQVQIRRKLAQLIQDNKMAEAYELVGMYPALESVDFFVEYEKVFDKAVSIAMISVGRGDIQQTQSILSPFNNVKRFKSKIRECIRQSAYNRLDSLFQKRELTSAQPIVAFYLKEFGKDNDYERLTKKYGLNE